ncbi:hypothetical protein H6P81_006106 [Aristolochia fimbriata]|uniref:Uncharacterized protein n=1 Tax=Aristolochia fimbriata TaxID=158543 RepID=A0AAV7EWJ5_ARIFI|nr:hypothetical protein H6P81_006106 [Aristolochia fimbriata]
MAMAHLRTQITNTEWRQIKGAAVKSPSQDASSTCLKLKVTFAGASGTAKRKQRRHSSSSSSYDHEANLTKASAVEERGARAASGHVFGKLRQYHSVCRIFLAAELVRTRSKVPRSLIREFCYSSAELQNPHGFFPGSDCFVPEHRGFV